MESTSQLLQIDEGTGAHLSRRSFLKLGVGALGALAVLEFGTAGIMFLRARSLEGKFGGRITAGPAEDFLPGSVTEFAAARFFLIRAPDGGFLAVHNRCPHLGCTVSWEAEHEHFLCPCHASTFDFYGNFDSPPVPRPLDSFSVQIEDGIVIVDTSQLIQRERVSSDQLIYA
jgi:nitrite reductase/ring-hydroxylating ferredoxin subunit